MKMEELIQKVSELYREERDKVYDLQTELNSVIKGLDEADKTEGKNITLADWNILYNRRLELAKDIESKKQYCEGISCVRELLMDLGFEADVKE